MQNKVSPLLANGISGIIAGGIAAAIITTATITTLTATTGTIGTLVATTAQVGSSGTAVDLKKIQASTVDVDSLSAGAGTSSAITFTGASANDSVDVSLTGNWGAASSSVVVSGSVTASDVVTLYWLNTSSSAVNLTSASYVVTVTSR